jgi:DNA-directed RNA polymerase subunit RPC12/RpoP
MSSVSYTCTSCGAIHSPVTVGGMSGTLLVRCNRCGAAAALSAYDDLLNRLEARSPSRGEAYSQVGRLLLPCECGGEYSALAESRCPSCAAPVNEEAYLAQTGVRWSANLYLGQLQDARWRKYCANCGAGNATVEPLNTARPYYLCASCRTNAA